MTLSQNLLLWLKRMISFEAIGYGDFYIAPDGAQLAIPMGMQKSDELIKYLATKGVTAKTFDHPPVNTVEESQKLRGKIPGLHTKNLFLRDGKKNYFLFVTDENSTVNIKQLARKIGAKGGLSFGSPEALMELLGIQPGSVSVLAAVNDEAKKITVVLDEQLLKASVINCHPLTNRRTTSLSQEALVDFLADSADKA
jgi:Ala-tRNA(Pro) deacylase